MPHTVGCWYLCSSAKELRRRMCIPVAHRDRFCIQGNRTGLLEESARSASHCPSIEHEQRVQSTIQGAVLHLGHTSALPGGFLECWLSTSFNQIRIFGYVCSKYSSKGYVFKQWGDYKLESRPLSDINVLHSSQVICWCYRLWVLKWYSLGIFMGFVSSARKLRSRKTLKCNR